MQTTPRTGYGAAFDAEYAALPESLKLIYSAKDFAWTSPEERARIVERECMPDVEED